MKLIMNEADVPIRNAAPLADEAVAVATVADANAVTVRNAPLGTRLALACRCLCKFGVYNLTILPLRIIRRDVSCNAPPC